MTASGKRRRSKAKRPGANRGRGVAPVEVCHQVVLSSTCAR